MPFCQPSEITVPEGRFRVVTTEDKEVIKVADSIKECGQLQAILVTKDKELVDGLCRLRACELLNREVWWEDEDRGRLLLTNPLERRRAELQANIGRSDFTPVQLANGIAELNRLMQEIHGRKKPGPSPTGEGWTQEETAKMLGLKSHRSVGNAMVVAAAAAAGNIPALQEAKTMQEALKMVKDVARFEATVELARRQSEQGGLEIEDPMQHFEGKIILGDCLEHMKKLNTGICSLFVTDPPWGIDMDYAVEDRGSAGMKAVGSYEDSTDVLPLLKEVINQMHRIGKPDCYVVFFCGVRHWLELAETFRKVGFAVYSKMLIWAKIRSYETFQPNVSRSFAPAIWPASAYDAAILARKGNPLLAQLGKPDVYLHPPVPSQRRIHQAEKPIKLMEEMISRFYHTGSNPLLIDPFVGSASTLIAARRLGIKQYFGYELNPEFRERAVARMVQDYIDEQKGIEEAGDEDFEGLE